MRKKILIMDDEEALCKEMTHYLVEVGYDAYYALNGHDGLASIEKKTPDLLLLDIQMPQVNGVQVLQELVQNYTSLKVVVISGYLDAEMTTKMIEFGAAVCMDKPFKLEELHKRVIEPLIGPAKEF
jgi:DNA-binding response OmpR family regulator